MTEEWKKFVDHPERHPFAMKFSPFKSNFKITKTYTSQIPKNFKPNLMDFTLLRQILYRRSRGMNTFIFIFGNVRSGKSWTGLKLLELYMKENNQELDVDKQVSFTLPKFLKWSSTQTDSCFMVDEIQLSMGAREWWNVQHRIMNQFCDIQGFRRNLAIFTLPNVSYVDKHIRFLCNYYIVTINQGFVAENRLIYPFFSTFSILCSKSYTDLETNWIISPFIFLCAPSTSPSLLLSSMFSVARSIDRMNPWSSLNIQATTTVM